MKKYNFCFENFGMTKRGFVIFMNCWILSLVLLGSWSCESNVKGDLGLGGYVPKLVVNASLRASVPPTVSLTKSTGILSNDGLYPYVEDASVTLFDGITSYSLTYMGEGNYKASFVPQVGRNYRLEIASPEFSNVLSNTHVPKAIVYQNLSITDSVLVSELGHSISGLNITIEDEQNTPNFYELILYQKSSSDVIFTLPLRSNNLSIENTASSDVVGGNSGNFINKFLISDKLFEGKELFLEAQFLRMYDELPVYVQLKSLDKAYYNYLLTFEKAKDVEGNPFTEPISVTGNIKNGLGIFAGFNMELIVY